jgi:hypothetical protein
LTSPRRNLVWRFVIPAVAAAAKYGYETKIQSSKTTSKRAEADPIQIAQSSGCQEKARATSRLLLRGWPR